MTKEVWKMLLTPSHYWTFPIRMSQLIAPGGPEVKKPVKKCHLTQHPPTVFDQRISPFTHLESRKTSVLKNVL